MKNKFKLRDLLLEDMSAKQRNTPPSSRPQAAQTILQQIQDLNRRGIKTDATSLAGAGIDYGQITKAMAAAQDPSTAFDRKNSSKGGNGGAITLKDTEKKEKPTSHIFTTGNVKSKTKPFKSKGVTNNRNYQQSTFNPNSNKPKPQPKPQEEPKPKPQPKPQEAPKPIDGSGRREFPSKPQLTPEQKKANQAKIAAERARKKYYKNKRSERIRRVTGAISTASNLAKTADPSQMPREL